jgi:hypothetical protein
MRGLETPSVCLLVSSSVVPLGRYLQALARQFCSQIRVLCEDCAGMSCSCRSFLPFSANRLQPLLPIARLRPSSRHQLFLLIIRPPPLIHSKPFHNHNAVVRPVDFDLPSQHDRCPPLQDLEVLRMGLMPVRSRSPRRACRDTDCDLIGNRKIVRHCCGKKASESRERVSAGACRVEGRPFFGYIVAACLEPTVELLGF